MGRCLVIGAAGGVGRELCRLLDADGWSLVLSGRRREPLEELAATLRDAAVAPCDARDMDAVDELCRSHAPLAGAANLAGSILLKPCHATSPAEFDEVVGQNLRTAFALVRGASRVMRQTGGSVVLVSTCAASVGLPNHEAIAAAKAGVEGLARSAAASCASSGIRINAVAPGLVETPLSERITTSPRALETSVAMHPLGRIGQPAEIAAAIRFLLSPDSAWITGQVLGVDGGLARLKTR